MRQMNTEYSITNGYCGGTSPIFIWGDPGGYKRASELEMMLKLRRKHDPGRPPHREPGDIYILIGAILGIIIGGAAGVIVANRYFGVPGFFIGISGGVIIGGFIGVSIGSYIKKLRGKAKEIKEDRQGPFISKKEQR